MGEGFLAFGHPLEGGFLAQEFEQEKRVLGGFHHELGKRSDHVVQNLDGFLQGGRRKFEEGPTFVGVHLDASFCQI